MEKTELAKLKKEARKNDTRFQRSLAKIYENKDGSLPDISHLEVKRKSKFKIFIIGFFAIAIILTAISWLGFILFGLGGSSSNKSVKLTITSQQNIASGDEVIYTLEYENIDKTDLNNVEMIFRYPENFEFISSQPEPTNNFNSSWMLGKLAKNQKGKIEIKGRIIGEVGSLKTINITASFQPENFSSFFKESASFSSQITSSILEIELYGPKEILFEKEAVYKIKYRNSSDQDLNNIKILAIYPTNFVFKKSSPEPFYRDNDARNLNNQWVISTLAKNQEGEIEITGGYLKDDEVKDASINIQIGFFNNESEEFSLQQEKTITTTMISQNLATSLIISGSTQNQPVNFGQTLTYSIIYKNLGQQDLGDVEISIIIDSEVADWATLEDNNSGIIDNDKITWTKDQISKLDLVKPLDEGVIDFSIQLKTPNNISQTNLQTKSKVVITLAKIGEIEAGDLVIESNEIINNINTDVQLKVEGLYFNQDNIPVGTGPLPPVVGEKTTFRIYWSIANSLHEVKNVKVSTPLPDGVEWVNKYLVSPGSISYSAQNNEIVWSIDKIAPNKGFDEINAWFDVAVTPTKQQEKKLLILTGQTSLSAIDDTTDSEIIKLGKAVTSNLEDDPIGGGKGLVIDISE